MKKKFILMFLALGLISSSLMRPGPDQNQTRLSCGPYVFSISPNGGLAAVEKIGGTKLDSDGANTAGEIILKEKTYRLANPVRADATTDGMRFVYEPVPGYPLRVEIAIKVDQRQGTAQLGREITVISPEKLDRDLTVRLPLAPFQLAVDTWLPLKNGVGSRLGREKNACYRFAGILRQEGISLAIPMVSFESSVLGGRCTILTDPYFSTLLDKDWVEWTYPKAVGLENGRETRTLALILHAGTPDDALNAFFRSGLSDVPAGPSWLHDIAMVDYDYLSDGGRGWFADIDALAEAVPEADRPQVLLCIHGWYDFVGRYCFDKNEGKLKPEWTAFSNFPNVKDKFPHSVPVALTLKKMHERIAYAKSRGFRTALYFADGMSAGDGLADVYGPEHVLYWGGWQGPDTKGKTYCQNPLNPEVRSFFLSYIRALLQEYGKELDALVWDETFHVDTGSLGSEAWPGYADRAMMRLVKDLTAEVHSFNRRAGRAVAFLASDCIGVFNWVSKPPYALVADGTYQDTHCDPAAWSYGIFPNYRNVLWSCNWDPLSTWDYTEFGVRNYQAAVAISNGWGDDFGFSEMSAEIKQKVLKLFGWRKKFRTRLRWMETLPAYEENRPASKPLLFRLETDPDQPAITFLSWDTEGGDRVQSNLLRTDAAVRLRFRDNGGWQEGRVLRRLLEDNSTKYRLRADEAEIDWKIQNLGDEVQIKLAASEGSAEAAEPHLPFDPRVTPTAVLPSSWEDDGIFRLPAVINAPDFGPILIKETEGRDVGGRLEGSREKKIDDIFLELPKISEAEPVTLSFTPLFLPAPGGLNDGEMWRLARRGWLNALQPCAPWGDQSKAFSAPSGILGNNVISDPASVSIWFYADQAFWMPEIAPGISLAPLVRRTIDYWLDQRMRRDGEGNLTGEITGYWDYGNFLDANASPLIAAWDYVESTGDVVWLETRIERLELVADFLARRDIDRDGLVEATQSGNRGTLVQPNRSCAWWDALNCGHKDGYTNALIFRAWRCLADLEAKLGRKAKQKVYTKLADKLKAAYSRALFNPKTGWLAWWKSADGELHDYASPTLNGLAIEYGLVEPGLGRQILDRLWLKMEEVGFKRFDLGVPPMLIPVRRSDYLLPDAIGIPQREDGTDTFGQYMNGGITAGQVLHFIAAHYVLGKNERADKMLRAMLERQKGGEFQNGVQDAGGKGIDWTTWDGRPSGYEGYLADSFRFLQAVLLREKSFRQRIYRPLSPDNK
jgi:hypothetical protein